MIRFRPMLIPTLWFLPGLALLVGLGIWQIERLHEKEALIATVQAGISAPPVPLADALARGAANAEWRHVRVTGHFLHDKEIYVFSRGPKGAVGVDIVTPLVLKDGGTVLIDRGFVPEALHESKTRQAAQVTGEVSLTGVLRLSQQPGLFTPAPNTDTRLWFVKDVPSMAKTAGVIVPSLIIEADATPNPGGWPLGGQTRVEFANDHLQYAVTWFGLALALSGVYLFYHRSRGRLGIG
ncbi:MAG TPA: SURF1 family protein [Micropepsaceae bacterium]|nr:SURF1 family protein [Micropepsaceae bacterium]